MPETTITKRIHVGGLTPNITSDHLKDRFKSFGQVRDVEDLGFNPLGDKRPFAFLTIETSPAQLKRCLNTMSGSMWRGAQLRLAEAKPKWDERLNKERTCSKEAVQSLISKKRKRIARRAQAGATGKEAQDMRPASVDNHDSKKFWILASPDHLVRPISCRPDHPLPSPIASSSDLKATLQTDKHRRAPPARARRRVINPSLWGTIHLSEVDILDEQPVRGTADAQGVWTYEDVEPAHVEDQSQTVGRWKWAVNGEVREVQPVRRKRPRVSGTPLEVPENSTGVPGSPLFARGEDDEHSPGELTTASPPFIADPSDSGEEYTLESLSANRGASPLFTSRSDPPTGLRTRTHPLTEAQSSTRQSSQITSTLIPTELVDIARVEKIRDLGLLQAMLGSPAVSNTAFRERRLEWGGFQESDSEEDGGEVTSTVALNWTANGSGLGDESGSAFDLDTDGATAVPPLSPISAAVLRLRGGGGHSESSASSDVNDMDVNERGSDISSNSDGKHDGDSSSEDSSSDTTSDFEDDSDDSVSESIDAATSLDGQDGLAKLPVPQIPTAQATKSSSALKDLFRPTPAGQSFSLLASLDPDMELDEVDMPPLPSPHQPQASAADESPLEPLHHSSSRKGMFDPSPALPLFFPTFGQVSIKRGDARDAMWDEVQSGDYQGFCRQETDGEMREIWERDRRGLTRDWKLRFREARKQRRKRGGGGDDME